MNEQQRRLAELEAEYDEVVGRLVAKQEQRERERRNRARLAELVEDMNVKVEEIGRGGQ